MKTRIAALAFALSLVSSPAVAETTEAILDSLQYTAFRYFWDEANPSNGLIKDRSTLDSPCSIAATGFGLTAICIAVDHGWVTRAAAAARVRTTLQTFWAGPQSTAANGTIGYQGLFYHFLDMNAATRVWESELSTIDTALLLAGILDTKRYFTGGDTTEVGIRAIADSINRRVNWNFMRNFGPGILMGWKPGTGFSGFGQWVGYNEAMIMYLLALGAPVPSRAVPATCWTQWTSGYDLGTFYGYQYVYFPPLFGHQYSHCWVDFRFVKDSYMNALGITYFENSRRATLAQRAYSIQNPLGHIGYSDSLWGITASDVPSGYAARGAPPAQNDDGTITPTAPISSIAFAPDEVIPVIRNLYHNYKTIQWGPYGFRDAFNLNVGWFATDVLGIDQGPIIIMIENYRTESVWNRFMGLTEIQTGLQRAGFTTALAVHPNPGEPGVRFERAGPNPFRGSSTLRFRLARAGQVRLSVHDLAGREVARLVDRELGSGVHEATFRPEGLPSGVYLYRLQSVDGTAHSRGVLVR